MKVRELIEALEEYDGELEVLIAHQPSYPLEARVLRVSSLSDIDEEGELPEGTEDTVYVVARESSGYASRRLFSGW